MLFRGGMHTPGKNTFGLGQVGDHGTRHQVAYYGVAEQRAEAESPAGFQTAAEETGINKAFSRSNWAYWARRFFASPRPAPIKGVSVHLIALHYVFACTLGTVAYKIERDDCICILFQPLEVKFN
jgi:hypothetical protein